MIHVEFLRAATRRTVISFKDRESEIQVRSLPQHLAGTGNNSVNRRLFHIKHSVFAHLFNLYYTSQLQSLNQMVPGLIFHYITPPTSFQLSHWLKRRHVTAQYCTILGQLQNYGVSKIKNAFLHKYKIVNCDRLSLHKVCCFPVNIMIYNGK